MIVLVDYANLSIQARTRGLAYIAEQILQTSTFLQAPTSARIHFRLYGGWYAESGPTRLAQTLATELEREFPRSIILSSGSLNPFTIHMELAYALIAEPAKHLLRTYRREGHVEGIQCREPAAGGCTRSPCPLNVVESFFRTGACPERSCLVEPRMLLFRGQQKLIDTMLTADFIHLAQTDPRILCIVSSDDDLWPGIRMALLRDRTVVHVHTQGTHRTHPTYANGVGPRYLQTGF
jgi:hypothetical protein